MAEAGLSGSNLSGQGPWSSMPQALPPERPRAKVSTIGSAVMELPGGVRIHFQDQPASFVAACAIELGLVRPLIAPVAQPQQRAKDTAASPATMATTASKRRDRKKASQLRWKLKEEEEAVAAATLPTQHAQHDARASRPNRESEQQINVDNMRAPTDNESEQQTKEDDGQGQAATAATDALKDSVELTSRTSASVSATDSASSFSSPVAGGEQMDCDGREEVAVAATAALESGVVEPEPVGVSAFPRPAWMVQGMNVQVVEKRASALLATASPIVRRRWEKHSDQLGKCGWTFAQPDAQGEIPLCVWLQDAMLSVELAVPVQQTYQQRVSNGSVYKIISRDLLSVGSTGSSDGFLTCLLSPVHGQYNSRRRGQGQ